MQPTDCDVKPESGPPPRTRRPKLVRSLTHGTLRGLLRSSGALFLPGDAGDDKHIVAWLGGTRCVATLLAEQGDRPGLFDGFQISTWRRVPEDERQALRDDLALRLPFARVGIDHDGDLMMVQTVAATDGVTEAHLLAQLRYWEKNMQLFAAAVDGRPGDGQRVLN